MRLEGKVAIISGGARGQGAAEAKMFAREGAKVVFGDILDDDGKQVEAEINETGGDATYVNLDVTDEDSWKSAVDTAVECYGKVDILVNNAGVAFWTFGDDASVEDWDTVMDINAKGVFLGTKAVIAEMRKAGRRLHYQHIVHIRHGRAGDHTPRLQRIEGRGPYSHQVHGDSVRQRGHPLQLRASRPGEDADDRTELEHAGRHRA